MKKETTTILGCLERRFLFFRNLFPGTVAQDAFQVYLRLTPETLKFKIYLLPLVSSLTACRRPRFVLRAVSTQPPHPWLYSLTKNDKENQGFRLCTDSTDNH